MRKRPRAPASVRGGVFIAASAALCQQLVLDVPQLLGEVHIVIVWVFKPLDLVPEGVDLSGAPGAHFLDAGLTIDQLARSGRWAPVALVR